MCHEPSRKMGTTASGVVTIEIHRSNRLVVGQSLAVPGFGRWPFLTWWLKRIAGEASRPLKRAEIYLTNSALRRLHQLIYKRRTFLIAPPGITPYQPIHNEGFRAGAHGFMEIDPTKPFGRRNRYALRNHSDVEQLRETSRHGKGRQRPPFCLKSNWFDKVSASSPSLPALTAARARARCRSR